MAWNKGVPTVEEESTRLVVRGHALEERESIADPVRGGSGELGRVEERIDADNLLEKRCHNSYTRGLAHDRRVSLARGQEAAGEGLLRGIGRL